MFSPTTNKQYCRRIIIIGIGIIVAHYSSSCYEYLYAAESTQKSSPKKMVKIWGKVDFSSCQSERGADEGLKLFVMKLATKLHDKKIDYALW